MARDEGEKKDGIKGALCLRHGLFRFMMANYKRPPIFPLAYQNRLGLFVNRGFRANKEFIVLLCC